MNELRPRPESGSLFTGRRNPTCEFVLRGDFNDCLHSAGGRGQLFEDCCAPCREAVMQGILTLGQALRRHEKWCGYNRDAPGDGIYNRADETFSWLAEWATHQADRLTPISGLNVAAEVLRLEVEQAPEIEWADVRVHDEISLLVFDRQEGLQRERRVVVGVDWPTITLSKYDGEIYSIDASEPDKIARAIKLLRRENP